MTKDFMILSPKTFAKFSNWPLLPIYPLHDIQNVLASSGPSVVVHDSGGPRELPMSPSDFGGVQIPKCGFQGPLLYGF